MYELMIVTEVIPSNPPEGMHEQALLIDTYLFNAKWKCSCNKLLFNCHQKQSVIDSANYMFDDRPA